jgi:predicted nucleic acid-binding protein
VRTAIDTNIILAIWNNEPSAAQLSQELQNARLQGGLVICGAVFAELLAHPGMNPNLLETTLQQADIDIDFVTTKSNWSLAGTAFSEYVSRRKNAQTGFTKQLLTDFIIGAHASERTDQLLTLDPKRYAQGFSSLKLIP